MKNVRKLLLLAIFASASSSYAFDEYNPDIQDMTSFSHIKEAHAKKVSALSLIGRVLEKTTNSNLDNVGAESRFKGAIANRSKTVTALRKAKAALEEESFFDYYRGSKEAYTTNDRVKSWFNQEYMLSNSAHSLTADEKSRVMDLLKLS